MKATIHGVVVEGDPAEILQLIAGLAGGASGPKRRPGRPPRVEGAEPRVARPVSAATQETRRLQGTYLGLVSKLSKKDRLNAKKIVEEKGKQSAIDWARSQLESGRE